MKGDIHREKTAEEQFNMSARGWLAYPVTPVARQLPPKCGCRNAENHRHAEHRRGATELFHNPVRGAKRMRAGGSPLRMPMSAALSRSDTDFNRVLLLIKFILSLKISQQKIGDTSPHPRFNQSSQPSCFDVAHLNRQNFFFNSRDL